MTIRYWPRRPRFPVIIDTGREVLGARTGAECSKRIARARIPEGQIAIPVIDALAEGFAYYPGSQIVSALAVKKRWTKSEIIEVYNSRRAPGRPEYVARSLGNKSVERLVSEIVELLCGTRMECGSIETE